MNQTFPANADEQADEGVAQPHLIIAPGYDAGNGELYIHKDLVKVRDAFANEGHIGPVKAETKLGDIPSWVAYIERFRTPDTFVTWNRKGIEAHLDYHNRTTAARDAHRAQYAFEYTFQFSRWTNFANGAPKTQKQAVEFLEDNMPDIIEPEAATLLSILRQLRATVAAQSDVELRPDGTANVKFQKDQKVIQGADAELPASLEIIVPVLKGHRDSENKVVRYRLVVRIRASVGDNAQLALRFYMPQVEEVLEQVYDELVATAQSQLGSEPQILRAAD